MGNLIDEQTWKNATTDYKNLHKLVENSHSIRSFAFKCQDVIINRSTGWIMRIINQRKDSY